MVGRLDVYLSGGRVYSLALALWVSGVACGDHGGTKTLAEGDSAESREQLAQRADSPSAGAEKRVNEPVDPSDERIGEASLYPGWTCQAFIHADDVWLRSLYEDAPMYDLRLGGGGAIAELRDAESGYVSMLPPSFQGESTDRVIQWTWWGEGIRIPGVTPAFASRYNLTQAGTTENLFSPTVSVRLAEGRGSCEIDIYSVPQDQWMPEVRSHIRHKVSALTRYRMLGSGAVMIRRVTLVGEVTVDDRATSLNPLYAEAWTPLAKPMFNAVAFSVDGTGTPDWWYLADYNFPDYQDWDASTTAGYVIAYQHPDHAAHDVVGLAFSRRPPCLYRDGSCALGGRSSINATEWGDGLALLPAIYPDDVPPGTVIDQHLILLPYPRLSAQFARDLAHMATLVPVPRIYPPTAPLPASLGTLREQLSANLDVAGLRTEHLGLLVR